MDDKRSRQPPSSVRQSAPEPRSRGPRNHPCNYSPGPGVHILEHEKYPAGSASLTVSKQAEVP